MFSANEIVAPAQRLSGLVLKRGPKQGSKWQTRFVELHDREVRVWGVICACVYMTDTIIVVGFRSVFLLQGARFADCIDNYALTHTLTRAR